MLHKYKEFLIVYNPEKELIRVGYADASSVGEVIDDLDNILVFYNYLFDKYNCVQCGKEIIKTNNSQKYCKECYKELEKARKREWKRNNKKVAQED